MTDSINWCDLKKNVKHIGEVSTSRVDGSPTGAEILTSTNEVTGQVRDTLAGKFKKMDDAFSSISSSQFIVTNFGNWSTVAGQQIEESDRLNGYEYPDDSGDVYAVKGSVTLPITRPTTPIGDDRFYLSSAVNQTQLQNQTVIETTSTQFMLEGRLKYGVQTIGLEVGQIWCTGSTKWRVETISNPMTYRDFYPLTALHAYDFGVIPDDYSNRIDNYNAIQEVLLTAITRKKNPAGVNPESGDVHLDFTGNDRVIFPAGVIYIEGISPFHVTPSEYGPPLTTYNYRRGLVMEGQGKDATIFEMCRGGQVGNLWFYKNDYPTANPYGWDTISWKNCTFRSEFWQWYDNTTLGDPGWVGFQTRANGDKYSGFFLESGGFEKFMTWENVHFQGLDTSFMFTGDSNVASNHWNNCKFSGIRDNVLLLDNGESVAHQFTACDFEPILGNLIYVTTKGGGCVNFTGGSIIIYPEYDNSGPIKGRTETALIRFEADGDSITMRSAEYNFENVTVEKYDPSYKLVNAVQKGAVTDVGDVVEPRYPASAMKANFRYCSFSVDSVQANDTVNFAENNDVVVINGNIQANISFDQCSHNTRHQYKAIGQSIAYAGGSKIEFISPRLLWDPVRDNNVPQSWEGGTLAQRCNVGNYAQVECNGAIPNFSPQWASKKRWFNLDFNLNNHNCLNSFGQYRDRVVRIKPAGHETITSQQSPAGLGNTAYLYQDAKIVKWEVYVPAIAGSSGSGQWKVYRVDTGSELLSVDVTLSSGYSNTIELKPGEYKNLSLTETRIHCKWIGSTDKPSNDSYILATVR